MNVYDFDKTIFPSDSTWEFVKFCLRKKPSAARFLPSGIAAWVRFVLRLNGKTEMKQTFYRLFSDFDDIRAEVEEFWGKNYHKISKWYLDVRRDDDVVVSASPEFLLAPVCMKLGVGTLIASRVDGRTGEYTGINCSGEEKVRRFREVFPDADVDKFYSDSDSDLPMARIAARAFKVRKESVSEWAVE
ncbi:MAG: haloacid dehalogenase-like hydrolase [Clostridia bacterium]|nr:haloacid dehalogenase-like hydrolase [Clostridia bacterium]